MLRWRREEKRDVNLQPASTQELRKFMKETSGSCINGKELLLPYPK